MGAGFHIYCPMCGYDVSAIPDGRCSECGFGYQKATIQRLADDHYTRFAWTYRQALWQSLAASGFWSFAMLPSPWREGLALTALAGFTLLPLLIRQNRRRQTVTLATGAWAIVILGRFFYPWIAPFVHTVCLVAAYALTAWIGISLWTRVPALPFLAKSLSTEVRRTLTRLQRYAWMFFGVNAFVAIVHLGWVFL